MGMHMSTKSLSSNLIAQETWPYHHMAIADPADLEPILDTMLEHAQLEVDSAIYIRVLLENLRVQPNAAEQVKTVLDYVRYVTPPGLIITQEVPNKTVVVDKPGYGINKKFLLGFPSANKRSAPY